MFWKKRRPLALRQYEVMPQLAGDLVSILESRKYIVKNLERGKPDGLGVTMETKSDAFVGFLIMVVFEDPGFKLAGHVWLQFDEMEKTLADELDAILIEHGATLVYNGSARERVK